MIDLWFLDQSGLCPTLPTGSGWGRVGRRLVVPYEAPQGRRVNVVGALAPYDPAGPRLVYETRRKAEGRDDAAAHLAFVRRLAGGVASRRTRPCVVVLDNSSVHHSQSVKEALPELETASVHFKAEAEELAIELADDLDALGQFWADLHRREHLLTADDRRAAHYTLQLAIESWPDDKRAAA